MMRRLPATVLTAVTMFASASARAGAQTPVDKVFERWNSTSSPGCALGVAQKGQPTLMRAYGMADLEHDVRNTPETVFEAGSVSKQFTAAAIVLLALDGKLKLDDDVRKYLPELPDFGATIRIRHMLNHTSGLRDWGSLAGIAGTPRGARVHTHAHVLDILSRQRALNFPPGREYSYSNSGYNLLAIIVDRVSGMRFAEFTRQRIFEPLGMKHTQWRDDFTRVVKNRAIAYEPRGQNTFAMDMPFENVHGNGGLLTTVSDLLIWTENLETGKIGGPEFLREMHQQGVLNNSRQISYASGLMVGNYNGVRSVSHTGSTGGYRAYLARYPEKGMAVAVLCNVGNANPGAIGNQLAAVYLGPPRSEDMARQRASVSTEDLASKAGVYRDLFTGEPLRLTFENGVLRQAANELVPIAANEFQIGGRKLTFSGNRVAVTTTDADTAVYERVRAADVSAARLNDVAGEYYSPEIETTLRVAVENGSVVIHRRPDTRVVLNPVYEDGFQSSLGLIRFFRDANGRVQELSVGQSRVYDLRFRRR